MGHTKKNTETLSPSI